MEKLEDKDEDEDETVEEKIHRLGEEVQELKEQVARLRNSLPPITRPPVPEPLIKLRHTIKEKDTERELLLEDQRASNVVEEYLKENPSILEKLDDCPICLEPMFDVIGAGDFLCCGNRVCDSCYAPLSATPNATCPLCREKFPPGSEQLRILQQKAKEGKAWAQCKLGSKHFTGQLGLAVDRGRKTESLFRKAADQGYSNAQFFLGLLELARNNRSEACRLFEAAASQGHMVAVGQLGILCLQGDGVEKDYDESSTPFNHFRETTKDILFSSCRSRELFCDWCMED